MQEYIGLYPRCLTVFFMLIKKNCILYADPNNMDEWIDPIPAKSGDLEFDFSFALVRVYGIIEINRFTSRRYIYCPLSSLAFTQASLSRFKEAQQLFD